MKYLGLILLFLLAACTSIQTPPGTETPIPSTATPQVIEITRVVKVEQTVIVTVTPEPLLAQRCFDQELHSLI